MENVSLCVRKVAACRLEDWERHRKANFRPIDHVVECFIFDFHSSHVRFATVSKWIEGFEVRVSAWFDRFHRVKTFFIILNLARARSSSGKWKCRWWILRWENKQKRTVKSKVNQPESKLMRWWFSRHEIFALSSLTDEDLKDFLNFFLIKLHFPPCRKAKVSTRSSLRRFSLSFLVDANWREKIFFSSSREFLNCRWN